MNGETRRETEKERITENERRDGKRDREERITENGRRDGKRDGNVINLLTGRVCRGKRYGSR
jgi:hypothetical protein